MNIYKNVLNIFKKHTCFFVYFFRMQSNQNKRCDLNRSMILQNMYEY